MYNRWQSIEQLLPAGCLVAQLVEQLTINFTATFTASTNEKRLLNYQKPLIDVSPTVQFSNQDAMKIKELNDFFKAISNSQE